MQLRFRIQAQIKKKKIHFGMIGSSDVFFTNNPDPDPKLKLKSNPDPGKTKQKIVSDLQC